MQFESILTRGRDLFSNRNRYLISSIIVKLLSVILVPLIWGSLGARDIGLLGLLETSMAIYMSICFMGLDAEYQAEVFRVDDGARTQYISLCAGRLHAWLILSLILAITCAGLACRIWQLEPLSNVNLTIALAILAVLMYCEGLWSLSQALVKCSGNHDACIKSSTITGISIPVIQFISVSLLGPKWALTAILVGSGSIKAIGSQLVFARVGINSSPSLSNIGNPLAIKYCRGVLFQRLLGICSISATRFFVASSFTDTIFAAFIAVGKSSNIINNIHDAQKSYVLTEMWKTFSRNLADTDKNLSSLSNKSVKILTLTLIAAFAYGIYFLTATGLGTGVENIVALICFILASYILACQPYLTSLIGLHKRNKVYAASALLQVLILLALLRLMPASLGIGTVAISYLASSLVTAYFLVWYAEREYKLTGSVCLPTAICGCGAAIVCILYSLS